MTDNAAVVRGCLEAIWQGDAAALAGHPAYANHATTTIPILHMAFPDLSGRIVRQLTEGDSVATWAVLSGTHTGEYNGVPPTGRYLEWRQVGYTRVVAGKVVEYEGMAELPSVLFRLGVIAPVESPG